jgi:hypothetical protein
VDIEASIARVKELAAQREKIDAELLAIFSGNGATGKRAPPKCSKCGEEGHRSHQCPTSERPGGTLTLKT